MVSVGQSPSQEIKRRPGSQEKPPAALESFLCKESNPAVFTGNGLNDLSATDFNGTLLSITGHFLARSTNRPLLIKQSVLTGLSSSPKGKDNNDNSHNITGNHSPLKCSNLLDSILAEYYGIVMLYHKT